MLRKNPLFCQRRELPKSPRTFASNAHGQALTIALTPSEQVFNIARRVRNVTVNGCNANYDGAIEKEY